MLRYYTAILENTQDGFSVWFPDFDGCASGGDTIEEAAANAEEGLALHIAGMIEDGDAIPEPTPMDKAPESGEGGREHVRILVRAELPGKSVRLNISMDEALVNRIDGAAKRAGMSRSAYLATAARMQLRDDARQ